MSLFRQQSMGSGNLHRRTCSKCTAGNVHSSYPRQPYTTRKCFMLFTFQYTTDNKLTTFFLLPNFDQTFGSNIFDQTFSIKHFRSNIFDRNKNVGVHWADRTTCRFRVTYLTVNNTLAGRGHRTARARWIERRHDPGTFGASDLSTVRTKISNHNTFDHTVRSIQTIGQNWQNSLFF